jgi:glycolate oxidase iron-sulfur subunit
MQHDLDPNQLGPHGPALTQAISACVHCGFCLPTCPTYQLLGEEENSPRGRIFLMKEVLEGQLQPRDIAASIDQCLGCSACMTACPSGVHYNHLLTGYRDLKHQKTGHWLQRLRDRMVHWTLPHRDRFRWAIRMGRILKPFARLVPGTMRPMLELLPDRLPPKIEWAPKYEVDGKRRARVALLIGCAQDVLAPRIVKAAISVLVRNGVEVIVPPDQGCCGALAWHAGRVKEATDFATALSQRIPHDVDAVLTTTAGCGSTLKEYDQITHPSAAAEHGKWVAEHTQDICQFLDQLGMLPAAGLPRLLRVAYHDACHLLHAQGIGDAPRRLLNKINNLQLIELPTAGNCCGSAGSYNIEQPQIAEVLGRDKAREILKLDVHAIATGNIGCLVQIQKHLNESSNSPPPVWHTIEVLERAYRPRSLTELDSMTQLQPTVL